MLFLNSRTPNGTISGIIMRDRSYTQKVGHSFVIFGCLAIVIGIILIVIGLISEIQRTTFIGVGVISLGVGCFLTTFVCLYGKLDICYNNWAYRSRIVPINLETLRATAPGVISHSPIVLQKRPSLAGQDSQAAIRIISEVEIHKVTSLPTVQFGTKVDHIANVT